MFTSKPVAWRRGIRDHVDSRAEFTQLANTIGRPQAKKFLEILYDKWVVGFKYDIANITPKQVSDYMKAERENFNTRKLYVDSLVQQSASGGLRTILNNYIRPTLDYYKNPQGGVLAGRALAIDQAANWVCGAYVPALPSTRALLAHYIPATAGAGGPMGHALGRTTQHLRKVFKRAVPDAAAYRINLMGGVKYPSTVGGSVLLEYIIGLTAGTDVWPPFGDARWEDIAMFYMTSIVHVQGFPDGNKRTGHLAYAIVLIKGTHAFKVPTTAKEGELFKMNG